MIVIGIDPGISGAIVALNGQGALVQARPMPILGPAKHRRLYVRAFDTMVADIQATDRADAIIEDIIAMPGRAASGALSSGMLFGAMLAVLQLRNVPIMTVRPQRWQKLIDGLPQRPSTKGLSPKEKARALARHRANLKATLTMKARLACPELPEGSKQAGYADAYWIAKWGMGNSANRAEIHRVEETKYGVVPG